MGLQVNVVLISFQNHIKITTTLQNNHHSKLPEGKSYNSEYKEEGTSRLVIEAETWIRVAPHPHMAVKNWEGYLGPGGLP